MYKLKSRKPGAFAIKRIDQTAYVRPALKATMAIAERFEAKLSIVVLGTTLALLSCVAATSTYHRRSLSGAGSKVFDVTSYGAKADGHKNNVEVSSKDDNIYFLSHSNDSTATPS